MTISNGNANTNNGGGINIIGGTATIDNCTISNNTAVSGGGIYIGNSCEAIIEYSTISGNTVSSGGGGVCLSDKNGTASMNMIGFAVLNNTVLNGGQSGAGIGDLRGRR